MKRTKAVIHYLITIQPSQTEYLHAYLMTNDRRYVEYAGNKLMDIAEKSGARPLPIILLTPLEPDGIEIVRTCLCEMSAKAQQTLAAVTDFHLSIFATAEQFAWHHKLMALH